MKNIKSPRVYSFVKVNQFWYWLKKEGILGKLFWDIVELLIFRIRIIKNKDFAKEKGKGKKRRGNKKTKMATHMSGLSQTVSSRPVTLWLCFLEYTASRCWRGCLNFKKILKFFSIIKVSVVKKKKNLLNSPTRIR